MKKKLLHVVACLFALSQANMSSATNQVNLGNILGTATQALENLTATDKFDVNSLVGNWSYKSPAVQFNSSNSLQKLGGVAAGTTIENKLAPYYNKLGLNKLTLSVDDDMNFVFTEGKIKLTGKISKEDSKLYFQFNAFNKISLGKVGAVATKSGNKLSLSFDAKKLVQVIKTAGQLSGNASLKQIVSLLEKYDGIYVGASFEKN